MNRRTFLARAGLGALAIVVAMPQRAAAAMTTVKMQAVASAITNAGFDADIKKLSADTWKVRARSAEMDIPIPSAHSLATAQGVNAAAADIEFS